MAGTLVRQLIDVATLHEAWLTSAELSVPIAESPRSAGLSIFLHSAEEAHTFLEHVGAPRTVATVEDSVRRELPVAPRRWFKLAFEHARLVAIAHYFQIDPRIGYPLTTIRRFFRGIDAPFPDALERALVPELDTPSLVWGLVARHSLAGGAVNGKLSIAAVPDRVPSLVERIFDAGAAARAAKVARLGAAESNETFVTFAPGLAESLQIDVSSPTPARLPCAWNGLGVDWPAERPLAYAKWRAADPTWTAYVPFAAYERVLRCANGGRC